jgi:hypothetical protein
MKDSSSGCTATKRLVHAACTPSACVDAFVNVCSHALNLLSNDCRDIETSTPQPGLSLFDVSIRSVTVTHLLHLFCDFS